VLAAEASLHRRGVEIHGMVFDGYLCPNGSASRGGPALNGHVRVLSLKRKHQATGIAFDILELNASLIFDIRDLVCHLWGESQNL
jgi:hypothetical protein